MSGGCEQDPTHNEDYCNHCCTCHMCVCEAELANVERITTYQKDLTAANAKIKRLEARGIEDMKYVIKTMVKELESLIDNSDGVAGIHPSDVVATWEELLPERLPTIHDEIEGIVE